MTLFRPKQVCEIHLNIDEDVSTEENKRTWKLDLPTPIVLSPYSRIFLNELKAKNTVSNYIKLYGSSFLDDTDSFDSTNKSAKGCLLYTIPFTSSPFTYPNTNLIVYYTFNKNFNDSSGNGYNLDRTPYDNSHYAWSEETIAATTTTFLRIGDELTFPSINQIPNIYNITSAGNHTIDFSTAGSIDVKLNGSSVLPSGFVKNGYPVLKQLLPIVAPIHPIVWYKFQQEDLMTDANGNYFIDHSGNNINLRLKRKGTTGNFPTITSSSVKGDEALDMNYVAGDIAYCEIDVQENDAMATLFDDNEAVSFSFWVYIKGGGDDNDSYNNRVINFQDLDSTNENSIFFVFHRVTIKFNHLFIMAQRNILILFLVNIL